MTDLTARYQFKGLTDEHRLIETMVDQSHMDRAEALFVVRHNIERCVEVWDNDILCGYFLILVQDKIRSVHGYKLCKGRTRSALRVALHLLRNEQRIYSCHKEADQHVNRLLKLLGFKEIAKVQNETILCRQVQEVSV